MSESESQTGVILLAYGGPRAPEEIEPFLARVTGGRPLPARAVEEVRRRYESIGGRSPLPTITEALAAALERRLQERGGRHRVVVGMLHSPPSIGEAVDALARLGVRRAVAIPLVPQYSAATTGKYLAALEAEIHAAGRPFPAHPVRSWATHQLLIQAFAEKAASALARLDEGGEVAVVFTAHSVPAAALPAGDPYEAEIRATAAAVAARAGIADWRLAYHSAGPRGGEWLGPSADGALADVAASGRRRVLVVPIQFLADNVEILHDVDLALRRRGQALGLQLSRSESLNLSPLLVEALAELAEAAVPGAS